jgi:hypothetical protein
VRNSRQCGAITKTEPTLKVENSEGGLAGAADRVLEVSMLSELIFSAEKHVANRFLLVNAISTATREFHRPGTRVQETVNDVLVRFGRAEPIASVEFVQEPPGVPGHWRRSYACWTPGALLELERILGSQGAGLQVAHNPAKEPQSSGH